MWNNVSSWLAMLNDVCSVNKCTCKHVMQNNGRKEWKEAHSHCVLFESFQRTTLLFFLGFFSPIIVKVFRF